MARASITYSRAMAAMLLVPVGGAGTSAAQRVSPDTNPAVSVCRSDTEPLFLTVYSPSSADSNGVPLARVGTVRSLLSGLFGAFLTLPGLLVVSALDSSIVFFLPLGNDFLVILM